MGNDVIVVGGGLAGLAAATLLAKSGARVRLFEKAHELGGRGRTDRFDGFAWNQGAHALYKAEALALLKELGVEIAGGEPPLTGGFAVHGRTLHKLPGSPGSIATTSLLGVREKLQVTQALAATLMPVGELLEAISAEDWITEHASGVAADTLRMLMRVSTYSGDGKRITAATLVRQLEAASKNVIYLDGGWQQLVDALREKALAAGVTIEMRKVERVIVESGRVAGVRVDGETIRASGVLLAIPPKDAAALVPESATLARASKREPVLAACLDLALSKLPVPENRFALGVDRPFYFSVHSTVAKVAPAGAATIHLMSYVAPAHGREAALREELEAFADLLQPGWREVAVRTRWMPHMVVSGLSPEPEVGRPPVVVPGVSGLCVAGDWVGPTGMLLDAALASARAAANALAEIREEAAA